MPISITLERDSCDAGGVVRGVVGGLDAHPATRSLRVSLVHDAKRWKDHPPVVAGWELADGRMADVAFELALPADAFPSFAGRRYTSAWRVEARLDLPGQRDVAVSEPLVVRVAPAPEPAGGRPIMAGAPGPRRFRLFAGVFLVADLLALAALYAAFGSVPGPVAFAFVAPALITLATLAWLGLRPGPVERFELGAPRERWRLGEQVPISVTIQGTPDRFDGALVALRGEEVWIESTGKSAHERRAVFHEEVVRIAASDLAGGRAGARRWEREVRFRLPEAAPPSREREIAWSVGARVHVRGRLDPTATLRLEVAGAVPTDHSEPRGGVP